MRKAQKKKAEDFIKLLEQAHVQIKKDIEARKMEEALALLAQCQEGALELGNMIEREEGEGCAVIPLFQSYCELVYQIFEGLRQGGNQGWSGNRIYKNLRRSLTGIENGVKHDIKLKREAVFLPYKASMWDSMESVWRAASHDPGWDAWVVPIPYYERREDGSLGDFHYEGRKFPDYVDVIPYDSFDLAARRPDVIYIHNPYDQSNYVTSVDPRYYSGELKNNTDCLIYIPYYATTGAMSEVQSLCLSYFNVDHIVVQSEAMIDFFDSRVPKEKFLPFGSPKFDRVIGMCKNPPPLPAEWEAKMRGRKVFFYNTSLGGMLEDTDAFLRKMEYVFHCFRGREDVCLLWRPHPLLEATFESMRSGYDSRFKKLKKDFMDSALGIYDDTPDITKTVAACDAYIGDSGTSVTSLFGVTGKPIFLLNNHLWSEPGPDDWRGQIIDGLQVMGGNEWLITQGNKLYHSSADDYQYEFYCDLTQYSQGGYYLRVMEIGGKIYACPRNAQDILVLQDKKIERRILLEHRLSRWGAFAGAWNIGRYLFLIPDQYPAIVRYDTLNDKADYIEGYKEVFTGCVEGQKRMGGSCVWENYLLLSSPADGRILAIEAETKEAQILDTGAKDGGCLGMITDGIEVWMSPFSGTTLMRWNPKTGELHEYSYVPEGFVCTSRPYGHECLNYPFGTAVFYGNQVIVSPQWGNMFLQINKDTGEMAQWTPPFEICEKGKNGYYPSWQPGYFLYRKDSLESGIYEFFSQTDGRLYRVDLKTNACEEIEIKFEISQLRGQEPGFSEISEWFPYGCQENCFSTLGKFLDGSLPGEPFDRQRHLKAYRSIAANLDGTCGEKIHRFACGRK